MHIAEQLPQGNIAQDIPHIAVGNQRAGGIKHHQNEAGDRLPDQHERRQPAQPEGGIDMSDAGMIKTGANVKPETVGVGAKARVGPAWFVTAQRRPDIIDVHAGRHALDNLISLGDDSLLNPHFADLFDKRSHNNSLV
jgi:hypothetical protein